jgi:minor curlin subunit
MNTYTARLTGRRLSWGLTLASAFALQLLMMAACGAADLSTLSDFGRSDILRNTAVVNQIGSGNVLQSTQIVSDGGNTGQYLELIQTGSDNQAIVEQLGDLNRARIDQSSSSNIANVSQNGTGNLVDLLQTGNFNELYVTQLGNNNSIVFEQPGSATATLVEKGDNNRINVSQGFGSNINIRLDGNNLTATVRQN